MRKLWVLATVLALALSGFVAGRAASRHRESLARGIVRGEIPPAASALPTDPVEDGPLGEAGGLGLRVPILMYHRVGEDPGRWPGLTVSPAAFERQVAGLVSSGARSLTVDQVASAVRERRSFPEGVFAITFDDGTADQYRLAFPILRRYGARATLYVPVGRVGRAGYLTWEQLGEMKASGLVEVAAHSITHRDLTRMPVDEAWEEIVGSRLAIEQHLGGRARDFAYPFGRHDPSVDLLVSRAGFRSAVTNRYGLVHAPERALRWGRMEVHERSSGAFLGRLAQSGGDWRRAPASSSGGRAVRAESEPPSPSPTPSPASAEPTESSAPDPTETPSSYPVPSIIPGPSRSRDPSPSPTPEASPTPDASADPSDEPTPGS
ncbi:MAG: polysaccharide deacetylase family protein [Acidobacteria bacterium]|nr:polysaccharide deacetylase family protein [Acidobacteriota bacterium]